MAFIGTKLSASNGPLLIQSGSGMGQVLVLSGGAITSPNEAAAADVSFYVSGSRNVKNNDNPGVSLFGGDIHVSGNLSLGDELNGGDIEMRENNDLRFAYPNTNPSMRAETGGDSLRIHASTKITVDFGSDPDVTVGAVFNEDGNTADFRVETSGKENAIWVSGSTDQVLILASAPPAATNEWLTDDINFYVSGSTGSRLSEERGTTLFGGDIHISGNLTVDGTAPGGGGSPGAADATGWFGPENDLIITTGSVYVGATNIVGDNADITLDLGGGSIFNANLLPVDFRVASNNNYFAILVDGAEDRVLILSGYGGTAASTDEGRAPDVNFYVSGSVGSRTGSVPGTSLFGGDLHVSGALTSDGTSIPEDVGWIATYNERISTTGSVWLREDGFNNDISLTERGGASFNMRQNGGVVFQVSSTGRAYAFYIPPNKDQVLILSGGAEEEPIDESSAGDIAFYVSGSTTSHARNRTAERGTALFGGDLHVSGNITVDGTAPGSHAVDDFVGWFAPSNENITTSGSVWVGTQNPAAGTGNSVHHLGADGSAQFNRRSYEVDFYVRDGDGSYALYIDGSDDDGSVMIHGRGLPMASGDDVIFFVSGSSGSQGTSDRGTSLFGGDVHVSGSFFVSNDGHDGSPSDQSAAAGSDVNFFVSGSRGGKYYSTPSSVSAFGGDVQVSGNLYLGDHFTGGDIRMPKGTDIQLAYPYTNPSLRADASAGDGMTINASRKFTVEFSGGGNDIGAIFNEAGYSTDFRVETSGRENALLISGSTNQVLILSGGSINSHNEATGSDVAFYVSGSSGSQGTYDRGTSLFGGDLFVSGALIPSGGVYVPTDSIINFGEVGSANNIRGDASFLFIEAKTSMILESYTGGFIFRNRAITLEQYCNMAPAASYFPGTVFNNNNLDLDFTVRTEHKDHALFVDASQDRVLILSGGSINSHNEATGSDVAFYVSGSAHDYPGQPINGSSLFGGDVTVSGSIVLPLYTGAPGGQLLFGGHDKNTFIRRNANSLDVFVGGGNIGLYANTTEVRTGHFHFGVTYPGFDAVFSTQNIPGMVVVDGPNDQLLLHSSGTSVNHAGGSGIPAGIDVATYISGTVGSWAAGRTASAGDTGYQGVTLVTGDMVVSGSLFLSSSTDNDEVGRLWLSENDGTDHGSSIYATDDSILYIKSTRPSDVTQGSLVMTAPATVMIYTSATSINAGRATGWFNLLGRTSGTPTLIGADITNDVVMLRTPGPLAGSAGGVGIPAGSDVGTYISGTVGTKDSTSVRGTTLVTGDMVVSGATHFITGVNVLAEESLYFGGLDSGYRIRHRAGWQSLDIDSDRYMYFRAEDNFFFRSDETETLKMDHTFGSVFNSGRHSQLDFRVATSAKPWALFVSASADQILILSGGAIDSPNEATFSDVSFYVSGSTHESPGAWGDTGGTALFGGDLHVSGTVYCDNPAVLSFYTDTDSDPIANVSTNIFKDSSYNGGAGPVSKADMITSNKVEYSSVLGEFKLSQPKAHQVTVVLILESSAGQFNQVYGISCHADGGKIYGTEINVHASVDNVERTMSFLVSGPSMATVLAGGGKTLTFWAESNDTDTVTVKQGTTVSIHAI